VSVRAALLDGLVDAVRQARIGVPVRQVDLCGQVRSDTSAVASAVRLGGTESPVLLVVRDITEVKRLETVRQDFVANVSHELRTPLASIRALAETLEDGAMRDASVATRFLGNIISETQRLTRIADDLLALTEAETRPATTVEVALDDLIHRVTQKLAPQAKAARQSLDVAVEPGLRVAGNADRLEQVLINLVDNAMKYTQPGGRLAVRAERTGQAVRIDVSDTGIGLMEHETERIFERFYRVDKARSRQSGGTGLGLSIVRRIVEAHGGTVTVTSELHKGSTFIVSLPALPDAVDHGVAVTPPAQAQVL
jgi:two-component system phosphate regulon sensor histidine kinase PhoR